MPKLYDKVKRLLEESVVYRNYDRELVWRVWKDEGSLKSWSDEEITKGLFMRATGYDTISRARRMVQADHPELQSTEPIRKAKKIKEDQKGTHVYREEFTGKLF